MFQLPCRAEREVIVGFCLITNSVDKLLLKLDHQVPSNSCQNISLKTKKSEAQVYILKNIYYPFSKYLLATLEAQKPWLLTQRLNCKSVDLKGSFSLKENTAILILITH